MTAPAKTKGSLVVWLLVALAVALLLAVVLLRRTSRPGENVAATTSQAEGSGPDSAPPAVTAAARAAVPSDFRATLEAARALGDPQQRGIEFGRGLREWLALDPDAALAYVKGLPRLSPEYTIGQRLAVLARAQRDPEAAVRLAAELATTREQQLIFSELFAQFVADVPSTALRRLAAVPAGTARENAVRALAEGWARNDFNAALAWARTVTGPEREVALQAALSELLPSDPLRAIQLAQETLQGGGFDRLMAQAVHELITTDPTAAAALVPHLPGGEAQTLAAAEVAKALAAKDAVGALAWARTLADGVARDVALARAVEALAATDPAAAQREVLALPPGETQRQAAHAVASALAAVNPEQALRWAQELPPGEAKGVALSAATDAWARQSPAAAAAWVAAQTDVAQGGGSEALQAALSYWILQDANAARDFVATLPGASQAAAADFVAPQLAQTEPVATLAWAQTLPDPAAREAAITGAYARWLENAPTQARAWLATAPLPPDLKSRLQARR